MTNENSGDLGSKFSKLSKEELLKIVNIDFANYSEEDLKLATDELDNRVLAEINKKRFFRNNFDKTAGFVMILGLLLSSCFGYFHTKNVSLSFMTSSMTLGIMFGVYYFIIWIVGRIFRSLIPYSLLIATSLGVISTLNDMYHLNQKSVSAGKTVSLLLKTADNRSETIYQPDSEELEALGDWKEYHYWFKDTMERGNEINRRLERLYLKYNWEELLSANVFLSSESIAEAEKQIPDFLDLVGKSQVEISNHIDRAVKEIQSIHIPADQREKLLKESLWRFERRKGKVKILYEAMSSFGNNILGLYSFMRTRTDKYEIKDSTIAFSSNQDTSAYNEIVSKIADEAGRIDSLTEDIQKDRDTAIEMLKEKVKDNS